MKEQEDNLEQLFINEKPYKMIIKLLRNRLKDDLCKHDLSKAVDSTYSHTVKVVDRFEELELIETKKEGRKMVITLTSKGVEVAKALENLESVKTKKLDLEGVESA
ncbi:MAG: winged helix DNA-binding protein [Nanohaloarchaea archaeon]|nr:winged helix DNA-binding protein [Candidatus Nanohaloarchaea archaeon]